MFPIQSNKILVSRVLFFIFCVSYISGNLIAQTENSDAFSDKPEPGKQVAQRLVNETQKELSIDYLLFLPKEYNAKSDKKWPVILFLHGAGKRGSNVNVVSGSGLPAVVKRNSSFPYVLISPQCPKDTWWEFRLKQLDLLIDEIPELANVDTDRIYLTGLSAGGFGSWRLASHRPEVFAAVAPICGGLNPIESHGELAPKMKNIPIWAFHGDADKVVPAWKSEKIVKAVNKHGGNAKLTLYPGVGHNSFDRTYANPKLYEWFNQHSLKSEKRKQK